ncbi:MAG TPA: response regulator, partial [Myxococcaceae bacterium]|nr:response regulator [Myxococcaceae bacterium]
MSEGQTDTESETSSPSGSEQRSGAGRRVLLVEPDDATRALLEGELAQEGFHPVTVASAQDAFALFASDQLPDVVLCDVNLGGGTDGFAFCAQVRAELRSVRLPVLLLSRRREEEEAAKASTAGADDYLSTPLLVSDVLTRVKLELAERPNDHTLATRTDQV